MIISLVVQRFDPDGVVDSYNCFWLQWYDPYGVRNCGEGFLKHVCVNDGNRQAFSGRGFM